MSRSATGAAFLLLAASAHSAATPSISLQDDARLADALAVPDERLVRAHVQFLADDVLEGRAPGTRGGATAARYIRAQFQQAGLQPGASNGTFFEPVRMTGVYPSPSIVIGIARRTMALRYLEDFVAWPTGPDAALVADADIVFAGYGIVAPEWKWDDYKASPVTGKIAMILPGGPEFSDSTRVDGRTWTRYRRWDYKLEQAARMGAIGAILVHTDEGVSNPWSAVRNTWSGERLQLEAGANRSLKFGIWMSEAATRRIIAATGIDYDLLLRRTARQDFRPITIGAHAVVDIASRVRPVESVNVIAKLPAQNPAGGEAVVLMAHYDHLGVASAAGTDSIFNGAIDNASGVATMLMAAAGLAAAGSPDRRTIYFVATTAKESGSLGAASYLNSPPVPLSQTAAVINIDGGNLWGATRDLAALDAEQSTLDASVRSVVGIEGMLLSEAPAPTAGLFFGSDHYMFARRGVPALSIAGGLDFLDRPAGWGLEQVEDYVANHYHGPSDEVEADFRYDGAVQHARILIRLAWHLAGPVPFPVWHETSEFRSAGRALQRGR
ncbi:MAG: M28 family peptidase [Gemmatimonadetes bacterium]|nr:M28 family peptidase [Gemmatimonadota bacterium]